MNVFVHNSCYIQAHLDGSVITRSEMTGSCVWGSWLMWQIVSFLCGTSSPTLEPSRPPTPCGLQRASTPGCRGRPGPGSEPTLPHGVLRVPPNHSLLSCLPLPSLAKPLRHYAVFLSEDSSDDERQREEGPSSGFTESFFFSAPFEWSLLPSISLSSAWWPSGAAWWGGGGQCACLVCAEGCQGCCLLKPSANLQGECHRCVPLGVHPAGTVTVEWGDRTDRALQVWDESVSPCSLFGENALVC